MKNFVYISPNFPDNHWNFCARLKENGLNVLGIGDCPYDDLTPQLKNSLNEYYKVSSLENYDEVYRACAFFIHKYGRLDWLESNNEYWLERDARLRDDFNINSGFHSKDMDNVKYKSAMKAFYKIAGVPVARYHIIDNFENSAAFCREVGYPVIVKPDNGVGASDTHKIKNDEELKNFIDHKDDTRYIMEEFIDAEVNSYDCIVNSKGEPLFETGNVTPNSLMDIVNNNDNCLLYIRNELPDELREKGRRVLKAFGVRSRFVHFEFFKLNRDQHIGKKDEIVALEVNMRPSGGISPTMMNYANGTDVYKIWADMIAFDSTTKGKANSQYCVFASRRDGKHFDKTPEEIRALYRNNLKEEGRVAEALSGAMADYMFMANFDTMEEVNKFFVDVLSNH